MSKTKVEKAAEILYKESLEKQKYQANTIAKIHQILNGRYKPEQDAEEQRSKGKFFGDSGETPVRAGGISRDPPG